MATHQLFNENFDHDQIPSGLIGGRYRLEQRIGEGASAITCRAYDVLLRRPVALKLLRSEYSTDQMSSARFAREALAAAAVNHPNVVQVYDYGTHDGQSYLVMQYIAGRNLKQVIVSKQPLAPTAAVRYVRRLLRGLGAIHDAGIVHRDVKPQNVLVGDDGMLRVTDFGIARGPRADTLTDFGATVGTAAYMAPEQIRGESVSAATDLYAVGVVLFELLTGRLPFRGEHPVAFMVVPLQQPAPAPSQFADDIPPALDAVVLRALAKNPADRFASAADMERALDDAVCPPTAGRPPARTGRVSEWISAAILVLLVLGLLGVALATAFGGGSGKRVDDATRGALLAAAGTTAPTATARVLRPPVGAKSQPTATIANLTATEPARAQPTPLPSRTPELRIVPVANAAPTKQATTKSIALKFGAADWQGGYYRGDATWYGRAWTAVYGAQSSYPRVVLTVSLAKAPKGSVWLIITGLDDEWAGTNPIVVSVNGVEIFSGPSPFVSWDGVGHGEQAQWKAVKWKVPAGTLHIGDNEVTLANMAPSASVGSPPYVLVSDAKLVYKS
jgi:eukaryotic-like serine/threonine-protein kinase